MSPELQTYYEERLRMMSSPAWNELMIDVQTMLDATNDVSSIQDEKTLHYRRGELSMMRWMLSIKKVSEAAYEELENEGQA